MADLRLRTADLELRWPSADDLDDLAELAAAGVHDTSIQPFPNAWTDLPPQERGRSVLQYQWQLWGAWKPLNWSLEFAVVHNGTVVGKQGIFASDFAVRREVGTGSWLGQAHHGNGIGTQMRAAVLTLAFEGLAAESAVSGAFTNNAASLEVSRKLGYRDNGIEVYTIRGRREELRRLRLDRVAWQASRDAAGRTVPVEITGLEPCLPHFGLPTATT